MCPSALGSGVNPSGAARKGRAAGPLNVPELSALQARAGKVVRAAGLEPAWAYAQRIFIPATAFAASSLHSIRKESLGSGLSLHLSLSALGAARLVSTPSRFRAWLGIAISKVSPTLGSSTSPVSRSALNFGLSPLRLPISPRPHIYSIYTSPGASRQARTRSMSTLLLRRLASLPSFVYAALAH